ncbi:glutaredoxin family protein [Lutimonas sp.]|uniref:glutaredoxin family protein n=1 Tax=Lutimonas sp. TaxID=1872403 RepID=UPI003D9BAD1C
MVLDIKLYGADRCHKTRYYKTFFTQKGVAFSFRDVESNGIFAEELRDLYENRKLHFPTITIDKKKLRNPSDNELNKWLDKLK